MTASADFPFTLPEIERAARSIRSYGVELDDLVAETAVVLLARARTRPDEARRYPTRMARWAAQDALRRLTGYRRVDRPTRVAIAAEALAWAGPAPETDEDEETQRQLAEWRALPLRERIARVAEAEAALGSSPTAGGAPRRRREGGLAPYGRTRAVRAERARMRAEASLRPRTCEGCGAAMDPSLPRQARHCATRCAERARRTRRTGRPRQRPPCAACGGPIPPTVRPHAVYCGRPCAKRAQRNRLRCSAWNTRRGNPAPDAGSDRAARAAATACRATPSGSGPDAGGCPADAPPPGSARTTGPRPRRSAPSTPTRP